MKQKKERVPGAGRARRDGAPQALLRFKGAPRGRGRRRACRPRGGDGRRREFKDAAHALEECRAALAKATTDAQRSQKDVKRARDAARHLAGELKSLTRDASEKEAENKLLEEGLSEAIDAARTMKNELREEQARSAAWAQRCGADAAARERGQAAALHGQNSNGRGARRGAR